jgi:hypothetical protein
MNEPRSEAREVVADSTGFHIPSEAAVPMASSALAGADPPVMQARAGV